MSASRQVMAAYQAFLNSLTSSHHDHTPTLALVKSLEEHMGPRCGTGIWSSTDRQAISAIAANTHVIVSHLGSLQADVDTLLHSMKDGLSALTSSNPGQQEPTSLSEYPGRSRDRALAEERDDYPSRSSRRVMGNSTAHSLALREWFLSHLPYPYPTYSEKRNLAIEASIPISKIDSDLTNWRRRSGWGEICETYARKSKDRMKMLMLRVQRGEETRPDLLEKVEGIRKYMDKECDKVGDWVHELASFARPEKRPKLNHASPTDFASPHGSHRSISSVSSSSSLSDISAFATIDTQPSDALTRDSPPTRSVSGSSALSDASMVVPSQGPKRSMSFTDDVEQVTNKAKTSHTPLGAEPTWVDSPTEYASSDTGFSGTYVSLDATSNSLPFFTSSSESSSPSSESDDGQHTGESEMVVGSATAVSNVLTVADSIMSSECSSIWSTELELPSLPHMHSGSASSWRIPTLSEFRPEIGRWVERG